MSNQEKKSWFFTQLKPTDIKDRKSGNTTNLSLEKFFYGCLCQIDNDGLKSLDFSKVLYDNDYLLTFLIYQFQVSLKFEIPFSTVKYIDLLNRLTNELKDEISFNLIDLDGNKIVKYYDHIDQKINQIQKARVDLRKNYSGNLLEGAYSHAVENAIEYYKGESINRVFKRYEKDNPLNVDANIIEINNLSDAITKAIKEIQNLIKSKRKAQSKKQSKSKKQKKGITQNKVNTKGNFNGVPIKAVSLTNANIIDTHLKAFKDNIKPYKTLKNALLKYFKTGQFPQLNSEIKIDKAINKKKLGWQLKEIHNAIKNTSLDYEYLRFFKENTNKYKNDKLDGDNLTSSNLYKYFNTKQI